MVNGSNLALCLGGGVEQKPLILACLELGWRVVVIDKNKNAISASLDIEFWNVSTWDYQAITERVDNGSLKVGAVLARVTGPALETAAKLNEYLGLSGPRTDIVKIANEKSELRNFCKRLNIPVPNGIKISSSQKSEFAKLPKRPWVVRPDVTLVGKTDISKCESIDALNIAISLACQSSANKSCDVATYVDGYDVTTLALFCKGEAVILTTWLEENYFGLDGKLNSKGIRPSLERKIYAALDNKSDKIKDYLNRLSSQFSKLCYPVAVSWRLSLSGEVNIIELHIDLTGDEILEKILLPDSGKTMILYLVRGILENDKLGISSYQGFLDVFKR